MDYNLSQEFVWNTIGEIESNQNKDRKKREFASWQIYDGNLRYYVENRVKQMYPKTWESYTISDYSVLKKIVDKKSQSYKEPPLRKLDNDQETAEYQKLLSDFRFNQAMKGFDRIYNQHKYSLMAVFMEKEIEQNQVKREFKFIPLAPYEYDLVRSQDGSLEVVILSYPDDYIITGPDTDMVNAGISEAGQQDEGRQSKVYAFWTETEHKLFKVTKDESGTKRIEYLEMSDNPEGINPFGVLPFVYIPTGYDPNYPVNSPLPYQTIELNSLMSVYLTSGNMQIGQLVLKYPADQEIEMVTSGLFTGMKLPQSKNPDDADTNADYISPTPNLSGHRESILTYLSMILDEQGINSNQILNPNEKFTSGFDRLLSSADLQGIIEQNQDLYHMVEQQVYNIIKKIYQNEGDLNKFRSEAVQVIYKKPKILVSDREKLENLKLMEDLGVLLEWQKFQIIDPNLSDEQAQEMLLMKQQEKLKALEALSTEDAFNGAQVASIVEVVEKVALGNIPRESGVAILIASFGISQENAERMLPSVGFTPSMATIPGNP